PTRFPQVAAEAERRLAHADACSIMKGEEVRRYIHTVMKFCPADYFLPGSKGGWLISQEDYRALPREIKQLVEEMQTVDKEIEVCDPKTGNAVSCERQEMLWVKFVSKTAAMGL